MTPERYHRIGELFDVATGLAEAERDAYLNQACGDDDALRREVAELLKSDQSAADFLSPKAAVAAAVESIGPYKIQRQLGEGGMGTVYLAEQSQPIQREVALKVIRAGMGSKAVIARFDGERRALALMDHPNIAQVFDAGATAQGLPYFVMEYVDGLPITRYCEQRNLSIRQRIELFIPVCQAIHHAHQKGVIHRDIKPSNVLVKELEGKAIPKVIDFGLVKALDSDSAGDHFMTNAGVILGTLQYMSPEQAVPGSRDIDTRSDVYSLGALLYELLTGATPLDAKDLAQENYLALLERVREQEPVAPSIRRRETNQAAAPLDHELDWIPLKALEKDRDRRYESVSGMVQDLERYLAGEPVEAAPPSRAYRVRKFVRRHRFSFGVAAAFLLVLITAVVVSVSMAVRARQAEREAEAVNAFLRADVLAQADPRNQAKPNVPPDANMTVRTALDRAARNISGKFQGQPLAEAAIRETIADAYKGLGIYPKAAEQADRALQLRRGSAGENDRLTLRSRRAAALLVSVQGRYRETEPLFLNLLADSRKSLGDNDEDTLDNWVGLAGTYYLEGKYDLAVEELLRVQAAQTRLLGADHLKVVNTINDLADNYFMLRTLDKSAELREKVLGARRRILGDEHPRTLQTMTSLAAAYQLLDRYGEAEDLYRRALAIMRRVNGVPHPETLVTMYNLATLLTGERRFTEALALLEENRAARGAVYPPDHPRTLRLLATLSSIYGSVGRPAESLRLLEEAYAGQKRVLGADHPDTLSTMMELGAVYGEKQPERGEPILREALKRLRKQYGAVHPDIAFAVCALSDVALDRHRYGEAERVVRDALEGHEWATKEKLRFTSQIAWVLANQPTRYSEAEPLLVKTYEQMAAQPNIDQEWLRVTGERIQKFYETRRQLAKAAEWRGRLETDLKKSSPKR